MKNITISTELLDEIINEAYKAGEKDVISLQNSLTISMASLYRNERLKKVNKKIKQLIRQEI